jgi:hypothetical protein
MAKKRPPDPPRRPEQIDPDAYERRPRSARVGEMRDNCDMALEAAPAGAQGRKVALVSPREMVEALHQSWYALALGPLPVPCPQEVADYWGVVNHVEQIRSYLDTLDLIEQAAGEQDRGPPEVTSQHGRFTWRGRVVKGLTEDQSALLWSLVADGHLREAVPVAEALEAVYGRKRHNMKRGGRAALRELIERTNEKLRGELRPGPGLRVCADWPAGLLWLAPVDEPPRTNTPGHGRVA